MRKWWIGAALAASCVAQSARAQAPGNGALLPDPVPVAPCPPQGGQQFVPGPLTGGLAPPGPQNGLTLPADVPTAWGRGPIPESGAYLQLGGMGLMRERSGSAIVAMDGKQPVMTTHDVDPSYNWGGRVTFGYLYDDAAIELTGFYIPNQETSVTVNDPGRLTMPFINSPAGFTGPSGTGFLSHPDSTTLNLQTNLGDAELNYRWWSRAFTGVEGIVGLRYVNLQERAEITGADLQSGAVVGLPVNALSATYLARANNNMMMVQSGFEWNLPLWDCLSFGVIGKAAFGADYVTATDRLTNGFGNVGAIGTSNAWTWSSVYEVDAFFDLVQFEKMRIRLGYTAMFALHIAEGFQQVNFNLASQSGSVRDTGSIFFHGPLLEVQFFF